MAVCVVFWILGVGVTFSQPAPVPLGPRETVKSWHFEDKTVDQVLPWYQAGTEDEKRLARAFAAQSISASRLAMTAKGKWGHDVETQIAHLCSADTFEDDESATLDLHGEHAALKFDVPGMAPLLLVQSNDVWRLDVTSYLRVFGSQVPSVIQYCDQSAAIYDQITADVVAGKYPIAENAIEALKKAVATLPGFTTDLDQLIEKGNKQRFAGDQDGAIVLYNQAIALAPFDAQPYNMRGFSEQEKKDFGKAVADFREAVRLEPNDSIYRNNLANALLKHGEPDLAAVEYNEALRLDPENIVAYMDRGRLRIRRADYAGAIGDLTKAASIKPPYPTVYQFDEGPIDELALIYQLLADAKLKSKDYEGAIAAYTRAISQTGKFSAAFEGRATAEEALGNTDGAKEDRATARQIKDNPNKKPR
jgi:tetratricopeptide (TPR) repeat protein